MEFEAEKTVFFFQDPMDRERGKKNPPSNASNIHEQQRVGSETDRIIGGSAS